MQDDLLAAIDTLYDCVGDDFDRERALKTFSEVADDSGVFISDIMSEPRSFLTFDAYNIPEGSVKEATSSFDEPDDNIMLRLYPLLPEGVPTLGKSFYSDEEYRKSPMYQRASKPWGLHSEGICVLSRGPVSGRICGFVRHQHQDELDTDTLRRIGIAGNHLQRAMDLQQRMDRLEEIVVQSSNILDLIEFGLVLFGVDRSPLYINAAAQKIFDAGDGLRLQKHGMVIGDRLASDQFARLRDSIYEPGPHLPKQAGGIVAVPRQSRSRPYSLMMVPLRSRRPGFEGTTAALFLFDPNVRKTTVIDLFVSSYTLTRSEAELAHCLALGECLDAIAIKRGVSRNTVKSQLHSIFAKTETSRQSELVSLLLRSVAGIGLRSSPVCE